MRPCRPNEMDHIAIDRDSTTVLILNNDEIESGSLSRLFDGAGYAGVLHDSLNPKTLDRHFGDVAHEIDLILLGVRGMPAVGRRAVERVRAHYDGPIMVLADRIDGIVDGCLDAGAEMCLLREETDDELLLLRAELVLVEQLYMQTLEDHGRRSQRLFVNILAVLARILEGKDPYTKNHSHNVCKYARMLGRRCGLSDEELDRLGLAAMLHDFGKIGITDAILNKSSSLTDEEYELMKTHPTLGGALLESLPDVADIVPAIVHHHERWDGRGYPDGLVEDESHLWARIINIADSYDTMSSRRAYKEPRSMETCVAEIERCAGGQFDPKLVELFILVLADEKVRQDESAAGP